MNHHHFASIDSTNTWGKSHLSEFDRNKVTLITADQQTAGRGQFNRPWVSPPDANIYATFCFFLPQGRTDIVNIPQVLAISAVEVLGLGNIKWPNDILIRGKKVAGILCETTPIEDLLGVVIGIGINVNMGPEWFEKIDQPATSLSNELGKSVDKEALFENLKNTFLKNLEVYKEKGFAPFVETLKNYLVNFPN